MSDVLKLTKKAFTVSVVMATILWSVGASVLVAGVADVNAATTLKVGDHVKTKTHPAIYTVNKDMDLVPWYDGTHGKSWMGDNKYPSSLIYVDSLSGYNQRNKAPFAVGMRPGEVMIRPSTNDYYYVTDSFKVMKIDKAAVDMYWPNKKVMTASVKFWPFYTVETGTITKTSLPPMNMLLTDGTKYYVTTDGKGNMKEVTAAGLTGNKYNVSNAYKLDATAMAKMTVATAQVTAYDATLSNVTVGAEGGSSTTPPTVTGTATVSLSAKTPAGGNLADGTAYNTVLVLNVAAGSDADVKLKGLTVTRTGLISNTNVTGVSVWDSKNNRYGEVMTSFNTDDEVSVGFSSNPLLVAKGTTEAVYVKFNLSSSASGGTVGAKVTKVDHVTASATVSASFPIKGNEFTVVDGSASLSTVKAEFQSVSGAASSSGTANVEVGDTKTIGKFKFTEESGYNDVQIEKITFYVEGTVDDDDLKDFELFDPSNNSLGKASYATDSYVTINLTTPYEVEKSKNRTLTLKATVADGSAKWVRIHIQNDYDLLVKDKALGYYVIPYDVAAGTAWTSETDTSGYFIVKSGSLTLAKASASPSDSISAGADDVVLATFDVKAVGEDMEIRKIGVKVATTAGSYPLNGNVKLMGDDKVLLTFSGAYSAALYSTGSQRTLSQYWTIKSGTTGVLKVVGSINDSASSNDDYAASIGNFYAKRLSSKDFADNQPSSSYTGATGNTMLVNAASLTFVKDTTYGNTTVTKGSTAVLGQYKIKAGSSEGLCLTNIDISWAGDPTIDVARDLQNLELYNKTGSAMLGSTISTVATSSNSFSMNKCLAKNEEMTLQLKGLVTTNAVSATASSSIANYTYVGQDTNNSTTETTDVVGQDIDFGAANALLTVVNDSTTVASILNPSTTGVQMGKWKLEAQNDGLTLNKITFVLKDYEGIDVVISGNYGTLSLYDSSDMSTALGTGSYISGGTNGYVRFEGMSLAVPNNGSKTLVLKGTVNGGTTMDQATTTAWAVRSDGATDMKITASTGSTLGTSAIDASAGDDTTNDDFATSSFYLFMNSSPVVANSSLGSSLGLSSEAKLFRYTVTNNGDREMRLTTTTFNVSASGLTAASYSTGTIGTWKLWEANSSGEPSTLLVSTTTCELQGGIEAPAATDCYSNSALGESLDVVVGPDSSTGDNWSTEYVLLSPGSTRTFVLTADTTGVFNGKTTGSVSVSTKLDGATGYDSAGGNTYDSAYWEDGILLYNFKQSVGGSYASTDYAASDSYDVTGDTLTRSL